MFCGVIAYLAYEAGKVLEMYLDPRFYFSKSSLLSLISALEQGCSSYRTNRLVHELGRRLTQESMSLEKVANLKTRLRIFLIWYDLGKPAHTIGIVERPQNVHRKAQMAFYVTGTIHQTDINGYPSVSLVLMLQKHAKTGSSWPGMARHKHTAHDNCVAWWNWRNIRRVFVHEDDSVNVLSKTSQQHPVRCEPRPWQGR